MRNAAKLIGICGDLVALTALIGAPAPQQGQVHANGISIAYETFGSPDRETVLLVAGTGMQLTGWPVQLCQELVNRGYRVVIYDNRDIGLSTKFNSKGKPDFAAVVQAAMAGKPAPLPYTLYDLAKDAVGLLDALAIKKAHIAGGSMGGMIAQIVATNYPERTLSLTSMMATDGKPGLPIIAKPELLAKIPAPGPDGDKEAYIERQVKSWQTIGSPAYPTDEAVLRQRITRDVKRSYCPPCEVRQGAASLFTGLEDRRATLKSIKVPTVVIHGAEDPLVPVEAGRDVAANIPGAELRIIPGMGHDIPPELVKSVADAITAAASRARPRSDLSGVKSGVFFNQPATRKESPRW
jgi:pimeloyl-ACP methyl ester carboxylesterase